MNIYLCEQTKQQGIHDVYDSWFCYADSINQAKSFHPSGKTNTSNSDHFNDDWTDNPDDITVTYLGNRPSESEAKVILASFNAG